MIRVLLAAVLLAVASPAFASDKSDVAATVNAYNDLLNKNDFPTAGKYFTPEAAIIDEFAPHAWIGPKAFEQWGADYGVYAKAEKMTDPFVKVGPARHIKVDGDTAYAVFPAVFTFKRAGKPVSEPALWTLALKKSGGAWKIVAWSWADK
jgi:ketosteroid isomerase-like protein